MAKENKSKYAVLGMLSIGPMSGYDLKKRIEQSVANFWSESYGQIYPILKQLTQEEMATSHSEKQEGKPERYIYTITDKGREELRHWLAEPIREYSMERNEFLLKLFFGNQITVQENIQHIQRFREAQLHDLHRYAVIEEMMKAHPCDTPSEEMYQGMTLSFGQHVKQALVQWCDETLATMNKIAETVNTNDETTYNSSEH